MSNMRLAALRLTALGVFVGSHVLLTGCNDPSRTSGTMVEESEEAKAYRQGKIAKLKSDPHGPAAASKAKGKGKNKKS
jgi:hypothetical protein